jgi:hypothetical protein
MRGADDDCMAVAHLNDAQGGVVHSTLSLASYHHMLCLRCGNPCSRSRVHRQFELESEMTFVGNDEFTMEMSGPAPDGKEFRMMEARYTRAN